MDVWFYSLLAIFCFFSFNHPDILYTIMHSVAPLNGHIMDFYEVVARPEGYANYLPATYAVFSLWGIPMRIMGYLREIAIPDPTYILFWFKFLTAGVFLASARVIYKICYESFGDPSRAVIAAAAWLSSPVAFFNVFIFGQYDVLTVFFMLLGMLYYVRGNLRLFSLWFGISISFKYFPAFVFFPLLLSREKNLKQLIICSVIFLLPNVAQVAFFLRSEAFVAGVLGFGAAKRAINLDVMVIWPLICAYSYFSNLRSGRMRDFYSSVKISLLALAIVFWHSGPYPQWFLILTPFTAVILAFSKNMNWVIITDVIFSFAFFSFTFRGYPGQVDTNLFSLGLWGALNPAFNAVGEVYSMSLVGLYSFLGKKTLYRMIMGSLFVLSIAPKVYAIAIKPQGVALSSLALLRFRFYGLMLLFLFSALYAYFKTLGLGVH